MSANEKTQSSVESGGLRFISHPQQLKDATLTALITASAPGPDQSRLRKRPRPLRKEPSDVDYRPRFSHSLSADRGPGYHDRNIHITCSARTCLHRKKINLSTVFAGQAVGLKEVEEGIWVVSAMEYDVGYIDLEEKNL